MNRDELALWLRLTATPGVGNGTARKLLAAFGPPDAVFDASASALRQAVSETLAAAIEAVPVDFAALLDATFGWLDAGEGESGARRILTLADPLYPRALLDTEDPPPLLYLMGARFDAWPDAVSIVGSRNPTPQGAVDARRFAAAFARERLAVVSGLALGIDGAAHEGALEGAADDGTIATIAVVGTGLDRVYPKRHLDLAHRIAARGLIVSEYPIGTPPLAPNFPKRNRIISALGEGTLVVEAALQSGSLITARQALEQGKDVYAIPGSIHSPLSRGCHALIKQGAKLVETAEDVLEELRPATDRRRMLNAPDGGVPSIDDDETATEAEHADLLAALGFDPTGLDALIARTGIPAPTLQAQLMELELAGAVARLPGGLFQRIGQG